MSIYVRLVFRFRPLFKRTAFVRILHTSIASCRRFEPNRIVRFGVLSVIWFRFELRTSAKNSGTSAYPIFQVIDAVFNCLACPNFDLHKSALMQHQWCGRIDLQSWNYKFSWKAKSFLNSGRNEMEFYSIRAEKITLNYSVSWVLSNKIWNSINQI